MATLIGNYTPAQIAVMSTAQIAALTTEDWAAFNTAQIAALTATQIPAINTIGLRVLGTSQFAAFEPGRRRRVHRRPGASLRDPPAAGR